MKKILIKLVRFYQKYISPAFGPHCRYQPTCSQYMIDALYTHGALKGLAMGTARILRCHPLVRGGIDYVPSKFSLRRNKDETYYGPYRYRVHARQPITQLQEKERLPWELLLLADPDKRMVENYLPESQLFVYREWNRVVGEIVVKQLAAYQFEIMNLAVAEDAQNRGIGRELIEYVTEYLKKKNRNSFDLIVRTGAQPDTALSFYQKCGFVLEKVVKNYFVQAYPEPIFEAGVQVKDQAILVRKIAVHE